MTEENNKNTGGIELLRHEDFVQNFALHNSSIHGRVVRMGNVLDEILNRHENPLIVNKLLGEMITLAAMLSAGLPEGGILTIQARGDGMLNLLVADATADGQIRGYADTNDDNETKTKLEELSKNLDEADIELTELMGKGYIAITLDTGSGEPYQGIVPLEGKSLSDAIHGYFTQSQQMGVNLRIFVNKRVREDKTERWRAGGLMIEQLPEDYIAGNDNESEDKADYNVDYGDQSEWEYNSLLINTATEEEILDPHLAPQALLYRLFNEGGVWVEDINTELSSDCRCSREKIVNFLETMSEEDINDMIKDDVIEVTCQFCNSAEVFDDADIADILKSE